MKSETLDSLEAAFDLAKSYGRFMDFSAEHLHIFTCQDVDHIDRQKGVYAEAMAADIDAGQALLDKIDELYANVSSAQRIRNSVQGRIDSLRKTSSEYYG